MLRGWPCPPGILEGPTSSTMKSRRGLVTQGSQSLCPNGPRQGYTQKPASAHCLPASGLPGRWPRPQVEGEPEGSLRAVVSAPVLWGGWEACKSPRAQTCRIHTAGLTGHQDVFKSFWMILRCIQGLATAWFPPVWRHMGHLSQASLPCLPGGTTFQGAKRLHVKTGGMSPSCMFRVGGGDAKCCSHFGKQCGGASEGHRSISV